ncbi:uncharacterized protein Dvir_GJ11631 [Drosophila virilis]|uniref:Uncharacterized protein n=1 Tax=Drosophila virilis TaxID=7244 RepID=B4LFA7_DROVI|nr:uncharacterized protein LOC6622507 [Drosophila virilis]EDW70295.2 uncharacterized protein Dvir_GJ11631 [Drosophila virilis]
MSVDSLRFVEIAKPYPNTIIANVTFKILRFIYPPFGHKALEVTYEVTLPDPDEWSLRACYICLSLLLLILSTCFVYKYFWRTKSIEEPDVQERKETAEPPPFAQADIVNEHKVNCTNNEDWMSDSSMSDSQEGDCQQEVKMEMTEISCKENGYTGEIRHNGDVDDKADRIKFEIVVGKPPKYPRRLSTP